MPRSNKIIIRSGTAAPTASDFVTGEPAWDKTNNKLYIKNTAGTMVEIGAGGGGGATEIYEYATTASFPATGAAATLYISTDYGRVYRWVDSTTKYVEIGSLGGDGSLAALLVPQAPTGVTGTAGNAQVSLTWTAPTSAAAITDYTVQYSSNGGSTWTTFSDGTSTTASATVTGLTNGTAYVFRVAAVSGIGTGSYSSASASVMPDADTYFSSVQLLLHGNGTNNATTFTDSSSFARAITRYGDTKISTTQSKWGGSSIYYDGSGDYLSCPQFSIGTADFCIEGWFYFSDTSYRFFLGASVNASSYLMMAINPTGSGQLWIGRSGVDWPVQFSGHSITTNTWYHIAVTRSGSSNRLYVDGTQIGSTVTNSQSWTLDPAGPRIGYQEGGNGFFGYMDDLRITVGQARYTGTTLTVPTRAFADA